MELNTTAADDIQQVKSILASSHIHTSSINAEMNKS